MNYLGLLLLSSLLIVVAACSQHVSVIRSDKSYYFPVDQWRIKGKLGVRTDTDSGSVAIDWRQHRDHYRIRVNGPLGQGGAWVEGDRQFITLQQPGRQPVVSTTPEQLLKETLGWFLPINDLRYWVQGVPNSNKMISEPAYDKQGMLVAFEQADWSVSLSRYKPVEKWLLPHKIRLNKNDVQLTLAIREWQFPQSIAPFSSSP